MRLDAYQSAKEEIKRSADIVELVGQYVQLKRGGRNFIGLCPFHSEKDPSFTVNPERQIFHCFGCKKGGDIFAFWMEYHKVSFPQAVKDLAERYHVALPEKPMSSYQREKKAQRDSLYDLNEQAAQYYQAILKEAPEGAHGRKYLDQRGISKDLVIEFRIGYATGEWNGLTRRLLAQGVNMDTAVQAGLVIPKKSGGYYDRFRGRIVFPILDMKKRVLGFGARVLDDSLPKYLNSPESPIFHKGKALYGIHAAYPAIRESGSAVIVEGYTDVLALRKHGFNGAVATLGTALTRDHIRMLKGYAREAVVVFDADTAGKHAALRSLPLFLDEGFPARVLVLPEGEDPDSYVHKNGLDGFLKLLERAVPLFDFVIELNLTQAGDQIEYRVQALKEMFPILSNLKNEAQRSLYIRRMAEKSGVEERALGVEFGKFLSYSRDIRGREATEIQPDPCDRLKGLDDHYLLNLLVHHPHTVPRLLNCRLLLSNPAVIEIFQVVAEILEREGDFSSDLVREKLHGDEARALLRETELEPSFFPEHMVEQALKDFENKVFKAEMAAIKKSAREKSDLAELNRLLAAKRRLEDRVF
ncbi:MAG: DNA primase [Deltaproteobacteria bacterium]|nr:DNA primase [Deltaproteobacteria bacterium]